jgi:signal peptidase II
MSNAACFNRFTMIFSKKDREIELHAGRKRTLRGGKMTKLKRTLLIMLIVISCVGCDQATKSIVKSFLPHSLMLSYFGDTVRIQYTENNGAFLSLGSSLPQMWRGLIFIGGVSIFLILALCYLLLASRINAEAVIAFSLVLGGGFSNLLDRIAYNGNVVDFMNLGIGSLRTGVFNAADVAIMAGMLLLVFSSMRKQNLPSSGKVLDPDATGQGDR